MSSLLIGLIIALILLIMMALGIPVAFALGLTAMISVVLFLDPAQFGYFADFVFSSLNNFGLLAIPLFVLMGAIFGQSKASLDLLEAAQVWIGRLLGGLAMSSVVACSLFAALTGSSPATSAAIGRIAIPEMQRRGYPNQVSTGAIVAGGTLGILIPPSVTLILYGIATETSIGRLFLAGVIPGILVTLLFCVWILIAMLLFRRSAASAQPAGEDVEEASQVVAGPESYTWKHRFATLIKVIPFIGLIVAVLSVLYLGIATPSEAAAVGALFALILVAVLYRSINPRNLMGIALETTRTSTMILLIVAFSAVLGQIMSFLDVPQELAQVIANLEVNRWVIFIGMNLLFLFLGFFIPPVAIILITMPVLFPVITELGFDPIWFGIVMTLNMEMGLITPPVGLNLYVVQGIAPDIPLRDILIGSLPYVGVLAFGILILALFPGVVTWLPNYLMG
ncbi:MAG TPA: TRAP transporter large permease [Rubrobacteraceae bacterium]|nr:TRAP transporter large permease [Rubrobacteraceae bacterium]